MDDWRRRAALELRRRDGLCDVSDKELKLYEQFHAGATCIFLRHSGSDSGDLGYRSVGRRDRSNFSAAAKARRGVDISRIVNRNGDYNIPQLCAVQRHGSDGRRFLACFYRDHLRDSAFTVFVFKSNVAPRSAELSAIG